MAIVRMSHPDLRLVLTGGALEALGDVPSWVDVRGLVSRKDLRRCTGARPAWPSRANMRASSTAPRGNGLWLSRGCRVVGSLPEVCGDAAVMFDADDSASIARGILEALAGSATLTERGLDRARMFTWARCADAHVRVYNAVRSRVTLTRSSRH